MSIIRRSLLSLAFLAALSVQAQDYCTTRERVELRRDGYSPREIAEICGDRPPPESRAPAPSLPRQNFATMCMTQVGPCQMMVPIPIGSYCTCYTTMGPIPGVSR